MRFPAVVLCAMLTACSGAPKLPEKVLVPVATPCITETIHAPAFVTDSELKVLPDFDFVVTLAKDRLERRQYIGTLEAAISGGR